MSSTVFNFALREETTAFVNSSKGRNRGHFHLPNSRTDVLAYMDIHRIILCEHICLLDVLPRL
ncbi:hypothetical protein CES86_4747 [Brucella lupini]|uniref:Uncharacterized protein n=1 Tax=Brucella lupini TaxID=255457 RepID=A0A256GCV0_9HYPH|nr:hypothetical protein CES86_4747 [Brucella lupini]